MFASASLYTPAASYVLVIGPSMTALIGTHMLSPSSPSEHERITGKGKSLVKLVHSMEIYIDRSTFSFRSVNPEMRSKHKRPEKCIYLVSFC